MQEKTEIWKKEYKVCFTAGEIRDLEKTEKDRVFLGASVWIAGIVRHLYVVVCYINYLLPLGGSIIAGILKIN